MYNLHGGAPPCFFSNDLIKSKLVELVLSTYQNDGEIETAPENMSDLFKPVTKAWRPPMDAPRRKVLALSESVRYLESISFFTTSTRYLVKGSSDVSKKVRGQYSRGRFPMHTKSEFGTPTKINSGSSPWDQK